MRLARWFENRRRSNANDGWVQGRTRRGRHRLSGGATTMFMKVVSVLACCIRRFGCTDRDLTSNDGAQSNENEKRLEENGEIQLHHG